MSGRSLASLVTPVPRSFPVVVRGLSPAVTARGVVWLWHVDMESDGLLVFHIGPSTLALFYGAVLSHAALSKFMHAACDGHACLL